MSHPMIGQKAPMLRLPSTPDGAEYALPIGQTNIALFFFPKANTTGCTKEACSFRDAKNENVVFKRLEGDLTIVGISGDSTERQQTWAEAQRLTYPILSDANGEARKAYKVSKVALGLIEGRETFFIDKYGIIRDVCSKGLDWNAHPRMVEKQLLAVEAEAKAGLATQGNGDATATSSDAAVAAGSA